MTLANYDRQITNLIARVQALVKELDEWKLAANSRAGDIIALRAALTQAESKAATGGDAHHRLLGWQDCARELLEIERTEIRIGKESVSDMIRRAQVNAS